MRSRAEAGLLLGLILALVAAPSLPALAERTQSNLVLVRSDDTITEDLYAAGNTVAVEGVIEGDLLAAAFSEIRIDGQVQGSVTAVASRVVVSGRVDGSLRVAARELVVDGEVGDDVVVAAWTVVTGDAADIGRDVFAWAWSARVAGEIGRDLEGTQRFLDLAAGIGRDADVTVRRLVVGPGTNVTGDLGYRSDRDALVADQAAIGGSVVHKRPVPPNVRVRALRILGWFLALLASLALGVAMIWAVPERAERAGLAVRRRPLVSVAWGLAILAIAPGLALVTGVVVGVTPAEAGLPLLIVLAPVVIAAFSLLVLALLAAPVPVASAVGLVVARERSPYAVFVIGVLVLAALSLIPWVGAVLVLVAGAAGLGGWMLSGEA